MKLLTLLILILFFLPFGLNIWVENNLKPVSPYESKIIEVKIPKGASVARIGNILENKGIIRSSFFFKYYLMYLGTGKSLKYGEYRFDISKGMDRHIKMLKEGSREKILLSIIPGSIPEDIAARISRVKFLGKSSEQVSAHLLARNVRIGKNILLVGAFPFISPDTYHLNSEMKLNDVMDFITEKRIKMIENLVEEYEKTNGAKLKGRKLKEKLILASIIQKEARDRKEMFLIASVFTNRLKRRIRLESCATINYILRKDDIHRSRLTYADLKIKSPYNTYTNYGLPPDLICIPGNDAIEAAFFPEKTKYLYFVLQAEGEHHFSKSLREHNRFKRKYKRELRKARKKKAE